MVLCASYSGDTEETLACYESAGALGAKRTVVTTGGRLAEMARNDGVPVIPLPGGFQPRAAGGLHDRRGAGGGGALRRGPRLTAEIDVAASTRALVAEWDPMRPRTRSPRSSQGAFWARRGDRRRRPDQPDRLPWKTQINEKRQQPPLNELPELDHNEIVGWEAPRTWGASPPCSWTTPTRTRG